MILLLGTPRILKENHKCLIPSTQKLSNSDALELIAEVEKNIPIPSNSKNKEPLVLQINGMIIIYAMVPQVKEPDRDGKEFLVLKDKRIGDLPPKRKDEICCLMTDLFQSSQEKIKTSNESKKAFPWETVSESEGTNMIYHWPHLDRTFDTINRVLSANQSAAQEERDVDRKTKPGFSGSGTKNQSTKSDSRNNIKGLRLLVVAAAVGVVAYVILYQGINPLNPGKLFNRFYSHNQPSDSGKPNGKSPENQQKSNIDAYRKLIENLFVNESSPKTEQTESDESVLATKVQNELKRLGFSPNKNTTTAMGISILDFLNKTCKMYDDSHVDKQNLYHLIVTDRTALNTLRKVFKKDKLDKKGLLKMEYKPEFEESQIGSVVEMRKIVNKYIGLQKEIPSRTELRGDKNLSDNQKSLLDAIRSNNKNDLSIAVLPELQLFTDKDVRNQKELPKTLNIIKDQLQHFINPKKELETIKDFGNFTFSVIENSNSKAVQSWNKLVDLRNDCKKVD